MGFFSTFSRWRRRRRKPGHGVSHPFESLPAALFPTQEYTASVRAWAKGVQDLAESRDCRLRRIVHCKATSGSRREFLLVYVRHPSGQDAIVLAERDTSLDPPSADEGDATYSQGIEKDMRALGIAQGRDRIRLSVDGTVAALTAHIPTGWAAVHTVRFPKASKAPSVAHLAALFTVIGRHGLSRGALVEAQSGWFAYCAAEVLRDIFGGKAKTSKGWVRVPYGGMKVEERDTVDGLIRAFTPVWEDFSRRGAAVERASERPEEKQTKKMDSFADMLRSINP